MIYLLFFPTNILISAILAVALSRNSSKEAKSSDANISEGYAFLYIFFPFMFIVLYIGLFIMTIFISENVRSILEWALIGIDSVLILFTIYKIFKYKQRYKVANPLSEQLKKRAK